MGVLSVAAWSFGATYVVFQILKHTLGIRVSRQEEMEGLDIAEHGMTAYSGIAASHGLNADGTPFSFTPHEMGVTGQPS